MVLLEMRITKNSTRKSHSVVYMASTRDKNARGNYKMEQAGNNMRVNYSVNEYGRPVNSYHPGDGLLPAKTSRTELSNNACDIESMLFGIGSCDLVNSRPTIQPVLKSVKSLSIIDRSELILPEPMSVSSINRPLILN
jgi:hypothetical protein